MVELRILGTPSVRATDQQGAAGVERQPKRLALLAYLATCPRREARPRDKLTALFWPDSDSRHARSSLSQSLYVLRAALGDDALAASTDAVCLAREHVWSDVTAFEEALDAGRPADALPLYRGDLLDGVFLTGCPEFEQWLDAERARLRQRASEGAWAHAESEAMAGRHVEATRWALWAADRWPADEVGVRRLMTFLHRLGDRTAAMRAYASFVGRLADEFDLDPSAETRALADELRENDSTTPRWPAALPRLESARVTSLTDRAVDVGGAPASESRRSRPRVPRFAAFALVAVLCIGVGVAWAIRAPEPVLPGARFVLRFSGPEPAGGVGGSTIELSPDGLHMAFVGRPATGNQLYLLSMDRLDATDPLDAVPVPDTHGATQPFFSPDARWLGYVMDGAVRKVPVLGGPSSTVTRVSTNVPGGTWGSDGLIVFATPEALWRVHADGGEPTVITRADTLNGEMYRWPHLLPDNSWVLATRVDGTGFHLVAVSPSTGEVRPLGIEGTNPRFVPSGYLVFARLDGTAEAARFDPVGLRVTGPLLTVAEDVFVGPAGSAKLAVSGNTLVYMSTSGPRSPVLVDRSGNATELPLPPQDYGAPSLSPDGSRIAAAIYPSGSAIPDVWVFDLGGGKGRRLTAEAGSTIPVWSPGSDRVAYAHRAAGRPNGWSVRWSRDDGREVEDLLPGAVGQWPLSFTPDGRALVFRRVGDPSTGFDLWILPLAGDRTPKPFLRSPANERTATLSHDGRWVAYVSDASESGLDEVYVTSFPEPGLPIQVSEGGGAEPRWARDRHELFYLSSGGIATALLDLGGTPSIVDAGVLFDDAPYAPEFAVHPDGKHFVMMREESANRIIMALNWGVELP